MIMDHITHADRYNALHPLFPEAFAFIRRVMEEGAEVGTYELQGKALYAFVQEYTGLEEFDRMEGHQHYIDIQMLLNGTEDMEVSDASQCVSHTPYDGEKDIGFYTCTGSYSRLEVTEGSFAIFFPEDLHKPGLRHKDCPSVRKLVVKVRI